MFLSLFLIVVFALIGLVASLFILYGRLRAAEKTTVVNNNITTNDEHS